MDKFEIVLSLERETKNTGVYVASQEDAFIETLYLQKSAAGDAVMPALLRLTVEAAG
jgi:hypothetical protein